MAATIAAPAPTAGVVPRTAPETTAATAAALTDPLTRTMPAMPDLPVAKGQALGNDYLVLNAADLDGPLETPLIRALCDRHRGAGSDGVLLANVAERPFVLRIFNPDGTEAEKSGNGLRIFGAWLHGEGLVAGDSFPVRLPKDQVTMQVLGELPGGSLDIVVDMGPASFRGEDVGFLPERGEALGHRLDLGDGLEADVNPVSMANPHCVVLVDRLERDDFLRRGPRLATHPAFAAGTNVQLARVAGPRELEAWIWERGAEETLASGSSASAVAAVAVRRGLVPAGEITIHMVGGDARIFVDDDFRVRLRAPAQLVYRARVPADVATAWAAGPTSRTTASRRRRLER